MKIAVILVILISEAAKQAGSDAGEIPQTVRRRGVIGALKMTKIAGEV